MLDAESSRRWALTPARIAGIAIMASIPVRLLTKPLSDPDLWWHLRTGRMVVADRALPAVDPFSYTASGRPWVVQEWLSEVILHGIHALGGLYGILIYRAVALTILYLLVARLILRRAGGGMMTWVLVALTAYGGASNWTERPNLLSFLLFAVSLTLLLRKDGSIWWFVPVAAVWANLHGMVVLGLGLVAVVAATEWLKVATGWEGNDRLWASRVAKVLLFGVLASFLNPYGPGLHAHAFRLLGVVRGLVTEWASPDFHGGGALIFMVLLLVAIAIVAMSDKRPDPTDLALMLAFTVLALQAARNLAVAAIVIGVVAAGYLPGVLARLPRKSPDRGHVGATSSRILNATGLTAAATGLLIVLVSGFPRSDDIGRIINEERYPAIEAIEGLRIPGVRVFAKDFWAPLVTFLDWPSTLVYIDLRWDFYGEDLAQRYRDTIAAQATWRSNLDAVCTTHVFISPTDPLAEVLRLSEDWEVVRLDPDSVTFGRTQPATGCERFPIPAVT